MDESRSTWFINTHPITAYVTWVAAFALIYLLCAAVSGGYKTWPLFVVFGALLPIAVILKSRRADNGS